MVTADDLFTHTENKTGDRKNVRIDSTIVCSDKRSKSIYRYINQSRHQIAKIHVDGGLISDTRTKKCDWLLVNKDSATAFFIELKGSNLTRAIEQINTTLDLLWTDIKKTGIRTAHARIVLSKIPRPHLMPNEKRKLEKRLKENEYGNGTVKTEPPKEMSETF
jgi:hypothetical protein